jgi:dienelactone hydrolase
MSCLRECIVYSLLTVVLVACEESKDNAGTDLEVTASQCQDNVDNDEDGSVDCDDAECMGFAFCDDSAHSDGDEDIDGCVGDVVPTADPTRAGPFEVAADKNVGPLAGVVPDPIYGDEQQRFSVYRPENLAESGYCHPILIWANGYGDNPEQNPPECIVDSASNQWCGQYLPMLNHLASHGFVVVAPLSTATAEGDPLPTIAGLDWILEQAEDSSSPYYHRLDTANIGQLGHSYGGMSTCMSASEPRYKALATICGTRALSGVHTPMLFFCGGNDDMVACSGVRNTFLTVTDQPAFFINELDANHGSWVYGGPGSPSLSSAAAWFRVHLMGDTENREYFYGASCTFCTDSRVEVEQNSLMTQ